MDDHIVSNYDESTSWGLIYNVFYDRLLGLELIDDTVRLLGHCCGSDRTYSMPVDRIAAG